MKRAVQEAVYACLKHFIVPAKILEIIKVVHINSKLNRGNSIKTNPKITTHILPAH